MDNDRGSDQHSNEPGYQVSLLKIRHADGSVTETIRTFPHPMPKAKATPRVMDSCTAVVIRRSPE